MENTTAIHEAGHAVAHVRLGIASGFVSIIANPDKGTAGTAEGEGAGHVYNKDGAADMTIAYCAGYAALVSAGYDEQTALLGADDDMEHAQDLIEFWGLDGDIADWRRRAVDLMQSPENVNAVRVLAEQLAIHKRIENSIVEILIDLADGECTEADFNRFLLLRGRDSWS